jgi:hypothetical protein
MKVVRTLTNAGEMPPNPHDARYSDPRVAVSPNGEMKVFDLRALAELQTLTGTVSNVPEVTWYEDVFTTDGGGSDPLLITQGHPSHRVFQAILRADPANSVDIWFGPDSNVYRRLPAGTEYLIPVTPGRSFDISRWYFWANGVAGQNLFVIYAV